MKRGRYKLKQRALHQQETRRRIIEAAVELHGSVGPAQTSISAIAERASVQRSTVYNHFPDERALFVACSGHFAAANPLPDPASWTRLPHPEERLKTALADVYAYHRRTEPMMTNVIRDAPLKPVLREVAEPRLRHWEKARDILTNGWGARGERCKVLLCALGHALDFQTWRSLARQQGLSDEQAIELMVGMVRCVTSDAGPGWRPYGRPPSP
jgi:AcrR family transcriptional regulator